MVGSYKTRLLIFVTASSSILSLLAELWWPAQGAHMRAATLCFFFPSALVLIWLARKIPRILGAGCLAGLLAALAYDLYRLPFVLAGLPLFKVFPRFGELLLGPSMEEIAYQLAGWLYHFCNGAGFGLMYLALAGPRVRQGSWGAIVFALAVEAGLLLSPYPEFFNLPINLRFVAITLSAHLVFGAVLGWSLPRLLGKEELI
ncbi:MAG: hypothetical protein U0931_24220 [Vulcanimicrobiota bacterium]